MDHFRKKYGYQVKQKADLIASDKTIDCRGANVHITGGAGLTIQFVKTVIVRGLHIHDIHAGNGGLIRDSLDHYGFGTASDGDGISVFESSHVRIDHNSISNCKDGLVDVIMGSTVMIIILQVKKFGASDTATLTIQECRLPLRLTTLEGV